VGIPTVDESGGAVTEEGTSEAPPLVAGVAALILSKAPDLAPYQVAEAIERTASHPGNWNAETGYGEVNATAALAAAEKMTPSSPTQASVSYTGSTHFAGTGASGSSGTASRNRAPLRDTSSKASGTPSSSRLAPTTTCPRG
jgi:subtilisin family serine protease